MIKGLAHIGLYVKDLDRSRRFYTEVLGFVVMSDSVLQDGTKICMVQCGSCMLELVEFPEYTEVTHGYFDHVALEVADIKAAMKALIPRGIVFESEEPIFEDTFNGIYYCMFKGPDGEFIELDEVL